MIKCIWFAVVVVIVAQSFTIIQVYQKMGEMQVLLEETRTISEMNYKETMILNQYIHGDIVDTQG
jgi:hypothetical protein